ncbi:MAG TPA: hypothetical protein VD794_14495 [Flavisolibacter sp.]|nr:hypothetical protein [Flavisolibacter sp.]
MLLTYAFSVILSIIVLTCVNQPNLATHDGGQVFLLTLVGSFYINLLLVLSATTVFLNLQDWIRENIWLRLSAFFFLPIVFSLFWIASYYESFFVVIALCFLAVRVYFYFRFQQKTTTKEGSI